MSDERTGFLTIAWQRKWWILIPTALSVILTSIVSYYFLPTRYEAVASLIVVPQRIPTDYVASATTAPIDARIRSITPQILSRSRLERIVMDLDLYGEQRATLPIDDVLDRMRGDIRINLRPATHLGDFAGFDVSFVANNPTTALRGTERLASLVIDESLRDRELLTKGTYAFLSAQVERMRGELEAGEKKLDALKKTGRPSEADLLEYAALKDGYKELLVKQQTARMADELERRQIGEQFRIIEPARLPEHPIGPTRRQVDAFGGVAGLIVGLSAVGLIWARER